MKNTLRLLIFILFNTNICQAQYLSFDELLSLRDKELDEVNDYLIKKKWEIDDAKEGDFKEYNQATWAFNKDNGNTKAGAWFMYLYANGLTNVVSYMTTSSSHHDLIKARMKALGFKLNDKAIEKKGLTFTYSNGLRTVKVKTDKDEDGVARFVFILRKSITSSLQHLSTTVDVPQNAKAKTGTVLDIDGNSYKTVRIGTQTWMTKNLKTTKYRDGKSIPLMKNNTNWSLLTDPACCYYNNDMKNKNTYGILYNWFCVSTNKLCPTGFHIPTEKEWEELISYLGGGSVAGGRLKINDFAALPSGISNGSPYDSTGTEPYAIHTDGIANTYRKDHFIGLNEYSCFWSSTKFQNFYTVVYCEIEIASKEAKMLIASRSSGLSVRCIKD